MIAQLNSRYIKTRPSKALTRLISYAFFEGRAATTKGRWINPLVLSFLKSVSSSNRQFKPVNKPIFILGVGRSGTTILGMVLSIHQDVGYLNEPKVIWHLIHPEEDVIGSYSKTTGRYRLNVDDATEEMCERARKIFGAYLSTTGTKRVVDKYPELIYRVDFVREIFPDARFILLVRNGWDTCQSIATWSERLGVSYKGETHDWWGVDNKKWKLIVKDLVATDAEMIDIVEDVNQFEKHSDKAVVEWVVTMREGLNLMEKYPECTYTVRFEELTTHPEKTLSPLCDFCELHLDKTFLDYARHTLHPVPQREHFKIHPKIAPIFYDTMEQLEYNT